jgi:hypothetical protein
MSENYGLGVDKGVISWLGFMPVILATWEAESEGSQLEANPEK